MISTNKTSGFDQIKEMLANCTHTEAAKNMATSLEPSLNEIEVRKTIRDTTQGKKLIEKNGSAPIPNMEGISPSISKACKGEMLLPEELEAIARFTATVRRLKAYLEKEKESGNSLAYYCEQLRTHDDLYSEITRCIRGTRIDDYATSSLRDIRRQIEGIEEKIRAKAESCIRSYKRYLADQYVVQRNGRLCIPVKKEYKAKIEGAVIEKSATGSTLFIEPKAIQQLRVEYENHKIEEEMQERIVLYTLCDMVAAKEEELLLNIQVIINLDFILAKAKLSIDMEAIEPNINLLHKICIKNGRHPLLAKETCVPITLTIQPPARGIVITGPNTGGKTVAIKCVALLSIMACSGLHIPCEYADIAMNNQVLCDIGDGQNLKDNLSTFSAHIKNVISILQVADKESLVILDEVGSGTDPAEGMGIAIAILEQLRLSGCNFLVTTHYPEVKEYANRYDEIINARMAFDKETLRPLYRLELGKAGDSCALYIAKHLGLPKEMLEMAAKEAYGVQSNQILQELALEDTQIVIGKSNKKIVPAPQNSTNYFVNEKFKRGDSVLVLPEEKIGIVVNPADKKGNVLVQIKKEKVSINHKRLKLKVPAEQLYPEDYDFSILFDTVENRKARHKMEKAYQGELQIELDQSQKYQK